MRAILSIGLLILLAPNALAEHCSTWSTSHPEIDVGGFYVDNDLCQGSGCLFSIWIYQELNGIPGLQRGDEVVDDTCHGMIDPDGFGL